jgi:sensor histidine kinase YesM
MFQGSTAVVYTESITDTIKELQVSNGTAIKRDGFFNIRTTANQEDIDITFIGRHIYRYHETLSRRPLTVGPFYLKNFPIKPQTASRSSLPFYSVDALVKNGKISSNYDSLYKIVEFQLMVEGSNYDLSSVFKGDSIPAHYSESLKTYFTDGTLRNRLYLDLRNVKYFGPDSSIFRSEILSFCQIFKDSIDLLIAKYLNTATAMEGSHSKVIRSDVRIKVEGNPRTGDIATIRKITEEFNSTGTGFKASIVRLLPSVVVRFDTLKRQKGPPSLSQYTTNTETYKHVLFFPYLSVTSILIDSTISDQRERDLLIWQKILRSVAAFQRPDDFSNSIIIGTNKTPGLTYVDKLALRTILSPSNYKKVDFRYPSESVINLRILFLILLSIISFFIFYEISYYFNIRGFIKNDIIRSTFYLILIAQLLIVIDFIVGLKPSGGLLRLELFTCGYALAAGWQFEVTDKYLLKQINSGWLRLSLNPFLTLISLYIAYQIIYLFVRAGFLRFISIDNNALLIGVSIVAVRFYLQYENEKITSLINEKEYELTRQKELKTRAELSTLQAKINPHFLYNALNSIAALAPVDSKRTEEMALSLSKLFRYNVNRDEDMLATISQEIEMVRLYLEIEKQRFGDRLNFEISVGEGLWERKVPRSLIQPVVENAIKHGISKITGLGIVKLLIFEAGKNLYIEIHDNGPEFQKGLVTGYGLQNTYDKLTLVYKKPYEIRFINEPDKYIQIKL